MGFKKYLNRIMKKDEKIPESVRLFQQLDDFYKVHPNGTPAVTSHVRQIRAKCDAATDLLQADFDKQHEQITAQHLREELDFVMSFMPAKNL